MVYDRKSRPPKIQEGERVFLFKPAEKRGKARKFARPFHGPYRVVQIDSNTAMIRRVDKPGEEPVLVALERLRRCPEEVGDDCWPPAKTRGRPKAHHQPELPPFADAGANVQAEPVVNGQRALRSDPEPKKHPETTSGLSRDPHPEAASEADLGLSTSGSTGKPEPHSPLDRPHPAVVTDRGMLAITLTWLLLAYVNSYIG